MAVGSSLKLGMDRTFPERHLTAEPTRYGPHSVPTASAAHGSKAGTAAALCGVPGSAAGPVLVPCLVGEDVPELEVASCA